MVSFARSMIENVIEGVRLKNALENMIQMYDQHTRLTSAINRRDSQVRSKM